MVDRFAADGGGGSGNVLHHVKRSMMSMTHSGHTAEGKLSGRGNVRGNVFGGNVRITLPQGREHLVSAIIKAVLITKLI